MLQQRHKVRQITLLGTRVHSLALNQFLDVVGADIAMGRKSVISYINIHALNVAFETPWFREFLNNSDLTFCDGIGVRLAAKLTGQRLDHRFTPPDVMDDICAAAVKMGWRIFFLGAQPGIAQRASEKLLHKFPSLQIETHHGYFRKELECSENETVIEKINTFAPGILFVGFGMPAQEKWIKENAPFLNARVIIPVGALFDYVAGTVTRAPRWMTDHGFEWLGRLVIEPGRLWRRYVIGNPLFFWRIFIHHFLRYPLPE